MKLIFSKTDILISILWILVYCAYLELFGDAGILFFLIHTPPIFFIVPCIAYIGYKLLKRELSLLPIITFVLIYSHLNFALGRELLVRDSPKADVEHSIPVRICSWNTAYLFKWGKEAGLQRLNEQRCDFVLLQEVWRSDKMLDEINNIRNTYFKDFNYYTYGEFLILAPKDETLTTFQSKTNGFFSISTTFKNKPLELTSVHLWNPITNMPTLINGKMTLLSATTARRLQKEELVQHLSTDDIKGTTSVIVGDFNTMQNGKIIRDIPSMQKQRYSFISTPIYIPKNTYSTRLPIIQIDFAYISSEHKQFSTLKTYCKPIASDHCLLIIDLML